MSVLTLAQIAKILAVVSAVNPPAACPKGGDPVQLPSGTMCIIDQDPNLGIEVFGLRESGGRGDHDAFAGRSYGARGGRGRW